MNKKRLILIILIVILTITITACGEKGPVINEDGSITETFSVFQGIAEDTSLYENYSSNPVIEYMESKTWGKNGNGNDVRINLEFSSAVAGQEIQLTNTLISTGSYSDFMDISFYSGSVKDLYDAGIALDITDYVEQYMPNYMTYLNEHEDFKKLTMQEIDGEDRFISLVGVNDGFEPYWGWNYRRDWIVKYADEVYNISPFSRWEDSEGNYQDNVIFPSGNTDPIYISDWEWMMEIFDYALDAEGITDGYVTSLYYPGYIQTGNLISASSGSWYKEDGNAYFGPTTDGFRAYLQMVNTWYDKGWVDTHFSERTNELFFQTGTNNFMTGRVGIWFGGTYALDDALETGEPNSAINGYTEDIFIWAAPEPINDMYGDESVQNKIPTTFYTPSSEGVTYIVTDKASDKELEAFFTFLDYTFSEEGRVAATFGLNKEQYEITQNELMTEEGYIDGTYIVVDIDGETKYQFLESLQNSQKLRESLFLNRFFSLQIKNAQHDTYTTTKQHSYDMIVYYEPSGMLQEMLMTQLSIEDAEIRSKTYTNLTSFLERNIPNFVIGEKDPFSDSDWQAYINAVNKYNPDQITAMIQELLDKFDIK